MIKTIYHGSPNIVTEPQYGVGNIHNDYGLGFYCTEHKDLAKEWAVGNNCNGYANCYQLDCTDLKFLDFNSDKYCVLNWLAVLLQNRTFDPTTAVAIEAKEYIIENFNVDIQSHDIIIGYRADDSYFSFAKDFLRNAISYRQLCNAMHLGGWGQQIVLKSQKAFNAIQYVDAEVALHTEWFEKKYCRDQNARKEYTNATRYKRNRNDIFVVDVIDREMTANDLRIQQYLSGLSHGISRADD